MASFEELTKGVMSGTYKAPTTTSKKKEGSSSFEDITRSVMGGESSGSKKSFIDRITESLTKKKPVAIEPEKPDPMTTPGQTFLSQGGPKKPYTRDPYQAESKEELEYIQKERGTGFLGRLNQKASFQLGRLGVIQNSALLNFGGDIAREAGVLLKLKLNTSPTVGISKFVANMFDRPDISKKIDQAISGVSTGGKKIQDVLDEAAEKNKELGGVTPENQTTLERGYEGLVGMAPYVAAGVATGGTSYLADGLIGLQMAVAPAIDEYDAAIERGESEDKATAIAVGTLAGNSVLNAVFLGGGVLNNKIKSKVAGALTTFVLGEGQAVGSQMIHNVATGRPVMEGASDTAKDALLASGIFGLVHGAVPRAQEQQMKKQIFGDEYVAKQDALELTDVMTQAKEELPVVTEKKPVVKAVVKEPEPVVTKAPIEKVKYDLPDDFVEKINKKAPKITKMMEDIAKGDEMPPVPVHQLEDGTFELNKDGAHRLTAFKESGMKEIPIKIEKKTELTPTAKQKYERDFVESQKAAEVSAKKAVEEKEKITSRVYERMQAEHPDALTGDLEATKIRLKDEAQKAVELIAKDKQKAFDIAMGKEISDDITSTAVNIAMSEKALAEGNLSLYAKLVKNRSIAQTRRGQEIVSEKGSVTDNSTARYVKELVSTRLEALGDKYLADVKDIFKGSTRKQKGAARIDSEIAKLEKKIRTKKLDVQSALSLLEKITCL